MEGWWETRQNTQIEERVYGVGERIEVGGWWDTGQQTQMEERVLGMWENRSRRMVGNWTANLDRRESVG